MAAEAPRSRSLGKRLLRGLLVLFAVLLALVAGVAIWITTEGSLARALQLAQRFLPEGQKLEFSDARGSITGGGRIGHLAWSSPGMALSIDDLRVEWTLGEIFDRKLEVRKFQALHVQVHTRSQPQEPAAPFVMPLEVTLPIRVQLPLAITRLEMDGVAIEDIAADYAYDGKQHALHLANLRYGQSRLSAEFALHATKLNLDGTVKATLRNLVAAVPFAMQAELKVNGTLAGGDASRVDVELDAREQGRELGPEPAASLVAQARLHPWRAQPLAQLNLEARAINAHGFEAAAPATLITGKASVQPVAGTSDAWKVSADFTNGNPGRLDEDRLPLDHLLAELSFAGGRWQAQMLQLQLGEGRAELQGEFAPEAQRIDVRGELLDIPLKQIHARLATSAATLLSGKLAAKGNLDGGIAFDADMASHGSGGARSVRAADFRALQARGTWSASRLKLARLHVDALSARIDGRDIDVQLPGLGRVSGRFAAAAPGFAATASADMQKHAGRGELSLELSSAERLIDWLRNLPFVGEQLPEVAAQGSASVEAELRGGWQQWLDGLKNPATQPGLHVQAHAQASGLQVTLPAIEGEPPQVIGADHFTAQLQGNLLSADLVIDGDLHAAEAKAMLGMDLKLAQLPGSTGAPQWELRIARLLASTTLPGQAGDWKLAVSEGLQVRAKVGESLDLAVSAGEATLLPPGSVAPEGETLELAWQPLQWQRTAEGASRLQSRGSLRGLRPAWLDALLAREGEAPLASAGLSTDLVLGGEWDVQLADRLDVQAQLKRDAGDLRLLQPGGEDIAAGIKAFALDVKSEGDDITAKLDWNTERAGVITANARTALAQHAGGWSLPDASPLTGTLHAHMQDLGVWGFLAPLGWRVQGALNADIRFAGTVQKPELQGAIEASGLSIRSVLDGVELHDGVLRAALMGDRLAITELTLQGGSGSRAHVRGLSGNRTPPPSERGRMTATGFVDWSDSGVAMEFATKLQKMQVLVRNDRQLSLSGDLAAGLQEGKLKVRGDIKVDRAAIMLPEAGAPTLGDDVVVVHDNDPQEGAGAAPAARGKLESAKPMDVSIKLDLGRDLALQGYGITSRLEGALTVSSTSGSDPFRIVGEVRTSEGRFRAWGQALNVETGVVLFNGPYSNPSLDLLAIRPEIAVRAGMRVTGTLEAPRVLLYSEPDMPESEKLSWVMLGRAAAASGAEGSSMQQAALGLLAGGVGSSIAGGLGLDELGLGKSSVSIGKRVSDQLYVTYEAGLSGAASAFYVFYDITRRFTVRGQTGKASAVDLIYTISYD